jgi:beta-D-xylosidase 4
MRKIVIFALAVPIKAFQSQPAPMLRRQSCAPATNYTALYEYVGCYTDDNDRTLKGYSTRSGTNSPAFCADLCGRAGYSYAGVEYGSQCYCGDAINTNASKAEESACNTPCPGDASKTCGQTWLINVYSVTNPRPDGSSLFLPDCTVDPLCSLDICDTSLPAKERAQSLISQYTITEKLDNLVNTSPGVARLGMYPYQWWGEGLHGLADSPGSSFASEGNFSYASSFPMPILMGAAFDDDMIRDIASIIGTETRAFHNAGRSNIDLYSPTINAFKDPRWGRGQECPGEDPLHLQNYVRAFLDGLEDDSTGYKKVIGTCKHYAANDFENFNGLERYAFDAQITIQELSEYYLPPFKTCAVEKNVGSFMCSYNGINGTPLCANSYLLQDIIREHWNWERDEHYVTTDCDCVPLMVSAHKFTDDTGKAAALAMKAGTDLECNNRAGAQYLHSAWNQSLVTEEEVDKALTRLMTALVIIGLFDGVEDHELGDIGWDAVNTQAAQDLAYKAVVSGSVLIKNTGVLPLALDTSKTYAFIGPFVEATEQMQGIYAGPAPFLISPLDAAERLGLQVTSHDGSQVNGTDASFEQAVEAAKNADEVIFFGGIDHSLERESLDRTHVGWPAAQLDVIRALAALDKSVTVVQFGGGQLDDTELLESSGIGAIVWVGLPGQAGGTGILDLIFGNEAPAGRLPITQYPISYTEIPATDMNLRPAPGNGGLGRTYMWYTEDAPVPFGHGLHYTNFTVELDPSASLPGDQPTLDTEELVARANSTNFTQPVLWQRVLDVVALEITVAVTNVGLVQSDYVALLFQKNTAGPAPRPVQTLSAYKRLRGIQPGETASDQLIVNLERLVRVDEQGNRVLFPGDYELFVDLGAKDSFTFSITGPPITIENFPQPAN